MDNTISTWLGHQIDPLQMSMPLDIRDIAHQLAFICRFNGGVEHHYSVAQHSIELAEMVPNRLKRAALLHDSAEVLVGDILPFWKSMFPEIRVVERQILARIMETFGVPWTPEIEAELKGYEVVLLATEKRDLKPKDTSTWSNLDGVTPLAERIEPLSNTVAEAFFLRYWQILETQRKSMHLHVA